MLAMFIDIRTGDAGDAITSHIFEAILEIVL